MVIENLIITRFVNGVEMKYTYKLTKTNFKNVQAYGIEVERSDSRGDNVINVVNDRVEVISPYRYKVKELLDILYKGEVSPIHLIDIIGEYVDKYVYDFDELEGKNIG